MEKIWKKTKKKTTGIRPSPDIAHTWRKYGRKLKNTLFIIAPQCIYMQVFMHAAWPCTYNYEIMISDFNLSITWSNLIQATIRIPYNKATGLQIQSTGKHINSPLYIPHILSSCLRRY